MGKFLLAILRRINAAFVVLSGKSFVLISMQHVPQGVETQVISVTNQAMDVCVMAMSAQQTARSVARKEGGIGPLMKTASGDDMEKLLRFLGEV